MKVLLLQDVKGVGRRMEILEVSPGYARNFLFPKKLAQLATPDKVKLKSQIEENDARIISELRILVSKLKSSPVVMRLAVGPKGQVFDSIKSNDVEEILGDLGFENSFVKLERPIRSLGNHRVIVEFSHGITETVTISVEAKP